MARSAERASCGPHGARGRRHPRPRSHARSAHRRAPPRRRGRAAHGGARREAPRGARAAPARRLRGRRDRRRVCVRLRHGLSRSVAGAARALRARRERPPEKDPAGRADEATERGSVTDSLGLIVGSGFDRLGLDVAARSPTKTPYGEPSSPVLTVRIGAHRVACIARHGERHALAPGFGPGDLAVPDQLIDYTSGRAATFGAEGAVGRETAPAFAALPPSMAVVHVDFTEPFDAVLRGRLAAAVADCGYGTRRGTYGVTQGPRLETAAEIDRLARDGCAMVGMTAMPEAVLARELGWAYAICAVAVNYAAGRSPEGVPMAAEIAASLGSGMARLGEVVRRVTPSLIGDEL